MENVKFTKPKTANFSQFGLGSVKVVAAIRDEKEVLCLVGEDKPYQPAGGRRVLKEIIQICEEGKVYYWKPIN